jgi:hypothetical protein
MEVRWDLEVSTHLDAKRTDLMFSPDSSASYCSSSSTSLWSSRRDGWSGRSGCYTRNGRSCSSRCVFPSTSMFKADHSAPAQAAWTPPSAQVGAAVQAAAPPTSPAPAAQPQAAPYTPSTSPPGAAVPPPNFETSSPSPSPARLAATDGIASTNSSNSTTLSSSSAAAIAIPLIVVALAILLLAGIIWWYKRHPTRGGSGSGSIRRRRTHREKDTASLSEKALLEIPGYETQSLRGMGSVRSIGSGRSTVRGVTVTPHLEAPLPNRPEPSVAPSIASIRRPTSMNITKPLPPISEYGGSVQSGTTSRTQSTIPVIHSATIARRADAQLIGSTPPPRSMHPTIMEEEHISEDETEASTTAPHSPRNRMRAIQKDHYSTTRLTSQYHSPPTASLYSTHSVTLPKSKRNGRSRRPIPQSVYSYTQSLPASIARNAPVSTVRRSPELPPQLHSPGSTADSRSLPEVDEFPPDHPFAQKYTPSSSSYKTCEEDTESMVRSMTARTELTLPWGFAEAKGKNGVRPLRQETASSVVKLCREETRKGADWAREQKHQE